MKDLLLIIASHKKINCKDLELPYKEVYRVEKNISHDFKNYTDGIYGIKSPGFAWSEYPVFFSQFPLEKNIKTVGLMHYRCLLALDPNIKENISDVPFEERFKFANDQLFFLNLYKDKIIITNPLNFNSYDVSAWQQFVDCHHQAEKYLLLACKELDKLIDVDSENILKTTKLLYQRSIFIAPKKFAEDWNKIAYKIAKFLDDIVDNFHDRDGAFILERLFSVYVYNIMLNDPASVVLRPLVYFKESI